MSQKTIEVRESFIAALANVNTMDELEKIRVEYIGKKGYVTELLKDMKNLSNEEKKAMGLAGRQHIEKSFSRERVIEAYLETIKKLI